MKKTHILFLLLAMACQAFSQSQPQYVTTLPILYFTTETRLLSLGEIGVVSSDRYKNSGLTQNPALLSRDKRILGFSADYTMLSPYYQGAFLADAGLYVSLDESNTLGYVYKHLCAGKVGLAADDSVTGKPSESIHSLRYAFDVSRGLSLGIGLNSLHSDLAPKLQPAFNCFSIDLGIDYRMNINLSEKKKIRWDLGVYARDLGKDVSFSDKAGRSDAQPSALAAGTMLSYTGNALEKVQFHFDLAYQAETLLKSTPFIYFPPSGNWQDEFLKGEQRDWVGIYGYFGSFASAGSTEYQDAFTFIHKLGAEMGIEFSKNLLIAFRGGYAQDFEAKGNGQKYSYGIGVNIYGVSLDYSCIQLEPHSVNVFGLSYMKNLSNR